MRRLLAALLALVLLPACDLTGDDTSGYPLRYEVTGTFATCQVSYTGENGQAVLVQTDLPFEIRVDAEPAGTAPFLAQLAASCAGDVPATVRARIYVSSLPTAEEAGEGTSAAVTASIALYADGRIVEQ